MQKLLQQSTAAVVAIAISLVGLGAAGWWWLQSQSPLKLQHQSLTTPATTRFLPTDANLTLILEADPGRLPDYGRAVAPMRQRRQAAEQLEHLRDALFAAAGLDYATELADWLGDESALAVTSGDTPGWVLALSSRDDDGGRQFLQRFWQSRSLAGGDLDITRYRGLGVISSRGQQSQGRPSTSSPPAEHPPLASALINDQLVLLASSRGQLEDALDASQEEARNLAGDPLLAQWLDAGRQGIALLRGDRQGIEQLLGLPASWSTDQPIEQFVGSLQLDGAGVRLAAQLQTSSGESIAPLSRRDQQVLGNLNQPVQRLSLSRPSGPLAPLFNLTAASDDILLPALLEGEQPLLEAQLQDSKAWLIGSSQSAPPAASLNEALAEQGFDANNLDGLQVWSHLTGQSDRQGQLQATVAGATGVAQSNRWWSNSLDGLRAQLQGHGSGGVPSELLERLNPTSESIALLGADGRSTAELLKPWPLWRGLQLLAGQRLGPSLQGAALALSQDQSSAELDALLTFH